MKTLTLILLLALVVSAVYGKIQPGKKFKETRCLKKQTVNCKYYRVCAKNRRVCRSHKYRKTKRCKKWGHKFETKRYQVCTKWNTNVSAKNKCVRCQRVQNRTKRERKAVCQKFHQEKICTKYGTECVSHKLQKKCWETSHPFSLTGPKTCPKKKMLRFSRSGNRIARTCVNTRPLRLRTCALYLDPHGMIDRKRFEFQFAGDFIAAKTTDGSFEVHARMKRFHPRWTGTVGFAVRVNGKDIVQYVGGKFLLNGSPMNPKAGKNTQLPNGGSVKRVRVGKKGNNWNVEVFAPNRAKLLYRDYGFTRGNLYVYIPNYLSFRGLCEGKSKVKQWSRTRASGLFNFRYVQKNVAPGKNPHFTPQQKKNAEERCKSAGAKGGFLQTCIMDVLLAPPGTAQKIIQIEKDITKQISFGEKMKA